MSAILLQLTKRPPETEAALYDLRFRALLGSEAWDALPPEVRRRFSKRLGRAQVAFYRGLVARRRPVLDPDLRSSRPISASDPQRQALRRSDRS